MKLYFCDPSKNKQCTKEHCFINGGDCHRTSRKEYKMKKLLSLLKKKNNVEVDKPTEVVGITDIEYARIRNTVAQAYTEASARRHSGSTKPSGCMRGLKKALDIIDSVKPHTMEVK